LFTLSTSSLLCTVSHLIECDILLLTNVKIYFVIKLLLWLEFWDLSKIFFLLALILWHIWFQRFFMLLENFFISFETILFFRSRDSWPMLNSMINLLVAYYRHFEVRKHSVNLILFSVVFIFAKIDIHFFCTFFFFVYTFVSLSINYFHWPY